MTCLGLWELSVAWEALKSGLDAPTRYCIHLHGSEWLAAGWFGEGCAACAMQDLRYGDQRGLPRCGLWPQFHLQV